MATSKKTNATTQEVRKEGLFAGLNHESKWQADTTGLDYIKLKDYLAKTKATIIKVLGFYINETDLGEAVTIIAEDAMINLPSHAVEKFHTLDTPEMVELINAGRLALANFKEKHVKKFNNDTIYFDYIDTDTLK